MTRKQRQRNRDRRARSGGARPSVVVTSAVILLAGLMALGPGACRGGEGGGDGDGRQAQARGTQGASGEASEPDGVDGEPGRGETAGGAFRWVKATSAREGTVVRLPAEVVTPEHAVVTAGFGVRGRVSEWTVRVGERVERGDTLAEVASTEMADLEASADRLRAELRAQGDLVAKRAAAVEAGFRSAGPLREARLEEARLEARLSEVRRRLRSRRDGGSLEATAGEGRHRWVAPVAGRVEGVDCAVGQMQSADRSCVRLLAPERAELRVAVPQHYLPRLPEHFEVQWRPADASSDREPVRLKLVRRGGVIDRRSRAVPHFFGPTGGGASLRPGAHGEATLLVEAPAQVVAVPKLAVTRIANRPHVFIGPRGKPRSVSVEIVGQHANRLLVRSPRISAGTEVLAKGAFTLKSRRSF